MSDFRKSIRESEVFHVKWVVDSTAYNEIGCGDGVLATLDTEIYIKTRITTLTIIDLTKPTMKKSFDRVYSD